MKVLIACEFSARVRDAFRKRGHDAWSCDIEPCEGDPKWHIQGDVLDLLYRKKNKFGWDLMIAFPPCTHLAVSGARWFPEKRKDGRQQAGIDFFMELANAPVPMICVENPVGIMSTVWRKPDQIIQPYQFGHPESKKTCLWLKNLPKLKPTKIMEPLWYTNPDGSDYRDKKGKRYSPTHYTADHGNPRWANQSPCGANKLGPSKDRWKIRSRTYLGIAKAMAKTWG